MDSSEGEGVLGTLGEFCVFEGLGEWEWHGCIRSTGRIIVLRLVMSIIM